MNETLKTEESIREYLLGRVRDEGELAQFEELLFTDEEFCSTAEIVEDSLVNDYVFKRLDDTDARDFEQTLVNNTDRRSKIALARALRIKASEQVATEKTSSSSLLDSLRAFFQNPISVGAFAVFLIAAIGLSFYFLSNRTTGELAELQSIYTKGRPTETRLAEFEYAPLAATRGETEEREKNKLRRIENALLEAVEKNPTAVNHHALGVFYLTQRKFAESVDELQKAVKLDDKNAVFHNDLGSALFESAKNGDKDKRFVTMSKANEEFSKALEINPNLLDALFNKSLYLQENQLFNEAKKSWELYLQKDSSSKWADEARKNLERIEQSRSGLNRKKEEILDDFLSAYRSRDDERAMLIHNSTKGGFTANSLADQLTMRYLVARQNRDGPVADESLAALKHIGNLEREKYADFFYADLAREYESVADDKIMDLLAAKNLIVEGRKLLGKGEYTKSITSFDESRRKFEQLGHESEAILAKTWYLQMLPDVGKSTEATQKLAALKDAADHKNYKMIVIFALDWLANIEFSKSNLVENINKKELCLDLAIKTENSYAIRQCSEGAAIGYLELSELQKAAAFLGNTTDIKEQYYLSTSQHWRRIYSGVGFFRRAGNYSTSIDFGRESLEVGKSFLPPQAIVNAHRELGLTLIEKKDFLNGLSNADTAVKLAEALPASPENNLILAEAHLIDGDAKLNASEPAEAVKSFDRSLEIYSEHPESQLTQYKIHRGKLVCFHQLDLQVEFDNEFAIISQLAEENREKIRDDSLRQGFFESEQVIFDVAIANALRRGGAALAFDYAEKSRARSLLDFVKSDKSITELESEFGSVAKPLNLQEIQSQMPDNAQILQYSVVGDRIAIWLIARDSFKVVEKKIDQAEVEQKTAEYREAILSKSAPEKIKQLAGELYNLLIPNELLSGKTICVIPDKSLFNIPFASLISPDGRYLIEDFEIMYSPSSSVFVATTNAAKSRPEIEKLLSIGNPNFDKSANPNLKDLPDAANESAQIAKLYVQPATFSGDAATKANFLQSIVNAQVIHFAGHFVINAESAANSKMVFADAELRSSELASRKLTNTKLVVLSACETAIEKVNKSEGSIGAARTFLALGAPAVVASGWAVDSRSAAELMVAFHKNRTQKNLSSIAALRNAQLERLQNQEFSSPYYWAAFSITGGLTTY